MQVKVFLFKNSIIILNIFINLNYFIISNNIAVADAVRTSLGPKGMDKMIQTDKGEVIITNDGATILSQIQVFHPCAKMLIELSKSQDIEAGDGTTSVVVLAGSLLDACTLLLQKGIHPTIIADAFGLAEKKGEEILKSVAIPVDLNDKQSLIKAASTSLASKIVSSSSKELAPMAVDAIMSIYDPQQPNVVDLKDIRVVRQIGGTIDDTELVKGLVFSQKASSNGPKVIKNAKVALIQFCLSAPKTDLDNQVVINEFEQMDKLLREERKYIVELCKKIKKSGCNVLLIQKSVLRDAVNDLSLHYLSKMGIMVIKDVERGDVPFISKAIGCLPIAHIDSFSPDKLATCAVAEEIVLEGGNSIIKITGAEKPGKCASLVIRGSNRLLLEEADRSIHDALCVVRSLVKLQYMMAGGGAPEIELSYQLSNYAKTLGGMESYCVKAYADALEIIPYTLAENAGLHPVQIVTELRKQHAEGKKYAGINVRKVFFYYILIGNYY